MVLILQLRLRTLTSTSNRLGVVAVERAGRLSMVQRRTILVVSRNQQRHTKRTAHDALLAVGALAEAQGQVADGLGAALDSQVLVEVEGVRLALDAGVLDHRPRVRLQPAHGAPDVPVDLDYLFHGGRLEQGRRHALLDAQHHALRRGDADGCAAELDGLEGVFDLEQAAFWGEGVDSSVWEGAIWVLVGAGQSLAEVGGAEVLTVF